MTNVHPWAAATLGWAMLGGGFGCAVSHQPSAGLEAAAEQEPGDGDGDGDGDGKANADSALPTTLGDVRCGAPDTDAPALLGLGEREVWLATLDGERTRIHAFAADDPAIDEFGLAPWRNAELLLVAAGARTTADGDIGPQSRVLFTYTGERLWHKRWAENEGGDLSAFGSDGTLLLRGPRGYTLVTPDGEERLLASGFTPFAVPDADGWLGGVFNEGETITGYGFQHARSDERRLLKRPGVDAGRDHTRPHLDDGRFYYGVVRADGVAEVVVESPDEVKHFELGGETELPELVPGETHTFVHVAGKPLFVIERATLTLLPLFAPELPSAPVGVSARGEWFTAFTDAAPGLQQNGISVHLDPPTRVYRVHAPSGRIDSRALPALPEGLATLDHGYCGFGGTGQSSEGRAVIGLIALDEAAQLGTQAHVESADGSEWLPLGKPVAFSLDGTATQAGESWLLATADVRNRYCPTPPSVDLDALPDDALFGQTQQVVAPDGEVLAVTGVRATGQLSRVLSLSADGECALETGDDGHAVLHDLITHDAVEVDLPNARFVYPHVTGSAGW